MVAALRNFSAFPVMGGVKEFAISLFDLKVKKHLFGKGTLNAFC